MDRPKKKEQKLEFVKRYLAADNTNIKCDFCKYNPQNYDMNQEFARIMRSNKCVNLIHHPSHKFKMEREKNKRLFIDNFKPLYDLEEYDERKSGEK